VCASVYICGLWVCKGGNVCCPILQLYWMPMCSEYRQIKKKGELIVHLCS